MTSTTRARVHVVLELLVCGLSRRQILEHVEKKHPDWQASPRSIDRLIALAHVELEAEARPVRARELAKAIRRLDMLFSRSLAITDFKACLAIERERIQLLNLSHSWPISHIRPAPFQMPTPAHRKGVANAQHTATPAR